MDQHNEFPKKFYGIITNTPGKNSLNIIDFEDNIKSFINYKIDFPFYFGFVPQTLYGYYPLSFIFFSNKKFDLHTKIELEPVLFLKVPTEDVLNIVFSKLPNNEIEINKENIESILKEFFEIEEIIKLAKAESVLENANDEYHKKFIKVYKKS